MSYFTTNNMAPNEVHDLGKRQLAKFYPKVRATPKVFASEFRIAKIKWPTRKKDLLLCVHAVVKTLNLEISRCHLADYVKESF